MLSKTNQKSTLAIETLWRFFFSIKLFVQKFHSFTVIFSVSNNLLDLMLARQEWGRY